MVWLQGEQAGHRLADSLGHRRRWQPGVFAALSCSDSLLLPGILVQMWEPWPAAGERARDSLCVYWRHQQVVSQGSRTAVQFVKGSWKGGEQRVWDSINANQVRYSLRLVFHLLQWYFNALVNRKKRWNNALAHLIISFLHHLWCIWL